MITYFPAYDYDLIYIYFTGDKLDLQKSSTVVEEFPRRNNTRNFTFYPDRLLASLRFIKPQQS